jgi:fused signal recognition particle receptor
MKELEKVHGVLKRSVHAAPHEVLLVLDAPTGQNALVQATKFNEAVHVTGVVLTKLDSTAKGGMLFAIYRELGLPVRFIGTGEKIEDLAPFDPDAFIEGLFEG